MNDDFEWMDATAQADAVRAGDVTPSELLEAALARIEARNPTINAVIHDLSDKARDAAADPALPDGPFRGVPFLLKDAVAHSAGDPYHCGMRVLKDAGWTEPADTWLVERFRAAGFVICGKTNTPELALSVTTEPLAYGATRNPWDTTRSPGGSSGGAGAAVASGMVAVAHGNDMGGSIRFPSSMCGLVGLKPTRARSTLGPDFGEYWAMTTHEHVLTRSVRDTAGVLDVISGAGVGDPYTAPPPARPFRDEVGADPGRLRVGFRTERTNGAGPSHPDCVAAVESVAALLTELGHDVAPEPLPALDDPRFGDGVANTFGVFVAADLQRWSEKLGRAISPDELEPTNALFVEMASSMSGVQYLRGIESLQAWTRDVARWWAEGHDLLLTPTVTQPPFELGWVAPTVDPIEAMGRLGSLTCFAMPFNVTGQPAISLPLFWNDDGLPIGVQLVAATGREDVLLRVASQLEAARPWADRHPPTPAAA
jgi:amidase